MEKQFLKICRGDLTEIEEYGKTTMQKLERYTADLFTHAPAKFLTPSRLKTISACLVKHVPNIHTQAALFSRLRKPLRAKLGTKYEIDEYRLAFSAGKEAWLKRKEVLEDNRANKRVRKFTIDEYRDLVRKLYHSEKTGDHALAAVLAGGMRKNELLQFSSFRFEDGLLVQRGVLKKREGAAQFTLRKPLVELTKKEFMALVRDVRAEFEANAARTASRIRATGERRGMSLSQARDAYVAVAHALYGQDEQFPVFAKRVLGHESSTTSTSYAATNIVPSTGASSSSDDDSGDAQ